MERWILTDALWAKMEPHCLGKVGDPGRSGADNRLFVEAVLWIARTGSPWRDLPTDFGKWNSIYVAHPCRSTPTSTSGNISSKISSANSRVQERRPAKRQDRSKLLS